MSFNLCSSGAITRKAGASASAVATASGALLADFCDQAEATLCGRTRFDWVTNYANVPTNFKPMLAEAVSDLAAMKVINFDMSNYTSREEAETMLDVLRDNSEIIIKHLQESKNREILGGE